MCVELWMPSKRALACPFYIKLQPWIFLPLGCLFFFKKYFSSCRCEPRRYSGGKMRLYTAVLLLLLTVLTLAAETPAYPQCAVCAISQKPRRERKRKLTSQLDCQKETSCGYTACLCSTHEALSSCITANCTTREDLSMHHHQPHHHATVSN